MAHVHSGTRYNRLKGFVSITRVLDDQIVLLNPQLSVTRS